MIVDTNIVVRFAVNDAEYFGMLLAMKSVRMESESAFRKAVAWYAAGDDFADALHLANAGAAPFYTFDGEFCKNAIAGGKAPAVVNPAKAKHPG